jgi:hypothetical protein
MAMTERGRIAAGAVSLLVVGAVVAGLLVFGGHDGGNVGERNDHLGGQSIR